MGRITFKRKYFDVCLHLAAYLTSKSFDNTYPEYVLDVSFWIEFCAIDIILIRRLVCHNYIPRIYRQVKNFKLLVRTKIRQQGVVKFLLRPAVKV